MNKYLILIACMMFFWSCSEENNRAPVTSDSTIPGQVSNVQIERLPGAIKLTYDIPSGQSLSYVKAECLINGNLRQAIASSYINTLTIEGFADTSMYTIQLYSINRSEKASEPVTVQAQPLSPSFREVFKTLQLVEDWGGPTVFFENPDEADLAITIIFVDSAGFWNHGETFYTKRPEGSFSARGYEPKLTTFGVYITDRWNNMTDTLINDLSPRFEKQLDRLKFSALRLPNDAPEFGGTYLVEAMFDGRLAGDPCMVTNADGNWPHWCTMDLGVTQGVLLSRIRIWQRGGQYTNMAYADRNIKRFEIWGTLETPSPDGSWDGWTLLMDDEMEKPSGSPMGTNTAEDMEAWSAGHDFSFPLDIPYVRYIRLLVKESWGNIERFQLDEIMFWGQEPSDIL